MPKRPPAKKPAPRAAGLLVLGMHRSGTSALARVLDLCGADIGTRVLGQSPGNDAGHWEDALAVEVHERLLAAHGTRWDQVLSVPADWGTGEVADAAAAEVRAYVARDRSRHPLWAVKDPRLSLFAPIWIDAAKQAGQSLGAVLMLRHPLEVAASLSARDGIATGRGLLLWLEYTLAAARAAEAMPHAVVGYAQLLEDWRGTVERMRALPGGEHLRADATSARAVEAFLDRDRRHHHLDDAGPMPQVVADAWTLLSAHLAEGHLPKGTAGKLLARLAPVRELVHPVLDEQRVTERQLWQRIAHAEAPLAAAGRTVPASLDALREAVDHHHGDLVRVFSDDLRRMQDATAEALQAAASREGEVVVARQLEPRLQAMEQGLLPLVTALPDQVGTLAAGLETNRQVLMAELQRMHEAASGLVPAVEGLPDHFGRIGATLDQHHAALIEAISGDLRRMQDAAAEALRQAAARERDAEIAAQVGPRLEALSAALERNHAAQIEAISVDLRRMQEVAGEATRLAGVRAREAEVAGELAPRLQALVASLETLREDAAAERRRHAAEAEALREDAAAERRRHAAEADALREDAAAERRRHAAEADALRREATGERERREAETEALGARLAAAIDARAELEAESTEAIAARDGRIAALASSVESLQAQLRVVEHEAGRLREDAVTLAQVLQSRSWRWTRPLRVLARAVTGRLTGADKAAARQALRGFYARMPLPRRARAALVGGTLAGEAGPAVRLPDEQMADMVALEPPSEMADVFVWAVIDWHFRFQRPQHLARALAARGHRVFYVSNNFVDAPDAGFRVDPLDRSGRLFQVHLNLRGAPPIYFDSPDEDQQRALQASLAHLLQWTHTRSSLSLVQHPYWAPFSLMVPNARVVYDCMDHHAGFENNAPAVLQAERKLLGDADLVIVTSSWLEREIAPLAQATALVRNAGDAEFFGRRPEKVFRDPKGRQVIGYYGAIAEWFDLALVRAVALAHPDALVLLIGNDTAGAAEALGGLDNVKLVGEVRYEELPYWLYAFDVALLPFKVIELTLATNPVKVYEYLAAGRPVVAVDLPEMAQFEGLVRVAPDAGAFVSAVTEVLSSADRGEDIDARREFAGGQTWEHRALELDEAISAIEEPRVSVVVLTYNNLDYSKNCLFSLEHYSDYPNLEIIVVDNASSDGSVAWLREWADEASTAGHRRRLILNDANLGFAAGNNIGLAQATGEVLVVLNNDTYVTFGWVRKLCAHLRRDRELGLVGPVTNNIGNEAKLDIAYDDIVDMHRAAACHTLAHPGATIPLRTAAFFCVAMPRRVFLEVGGLDEAFGVGFFEDDDYCRRVEQAGWRVACAEDVFVHHHLSASFDQLKAESRRELFETNKAIYEAKWGAWVPHAYRHDG